MRFHVGFSFRLKYLKKFLFPILIGILAYFGFGGLFGTLNVYAYSNYDTQYNLTYNGFYENESYYHGNDSLTFIFYDLINYYREHNDYYDLYISPNVSTNFGDNVHIYLINKNNDLIKNVSAYGRTTDSSSTSTNYFTSYFSVNSSSNSNINTNYDLTLKLSSNVNVLGSTWYNNIKQCLDTEPSVDRCSFSTLTSNNSTIGNYSYFYNADINVFSTPSYIITPINSKIDNDNSFTIVNSNIFYYSSFDLVYRPLSTIIENGNYYVKDINFITGNNNYKFGVGDKIYSYFDIINGNTNGNTNFESYNKLGKLFVGGINKNNINDFKIDLSYNYESYDYSRFLNYNVLYFGRKNNSTYYSYELLDCSFNTSLVGSAFDTTNKKTTTTIFPYGFNCSSNLNDYDNIYLYIEIIPNGNYDDTIYNLQYDVNYGYIKNLNPTLITSNNFYIYEKFINLNPDFEILLSTQDESNSAYFQSDNKYIVFNEVNRNNNKINSLSMNPIKFGIAYNSNAMLFNLPRYYTGVSNVELFVHYNTIVSIGNNQSFTYYDNSNNLITDTIVNNKTNNVDTDIYNMSYYFGVVDNFINDLSLSIISFSQLTQNFYNGIPEILQTFIFVAFILVCLYFTYLLVRK